MCRCMQQRGQYSEGFQTTNEKQINVIAKEKHNATRQKKELNIE